MNKVTYILILCIFLVSYSTNAFSSEIFYCNEMKGVSTPLTQKSKLWNLFKWLHNGVEKTETITGKNKIVVDGVNSRIELSNIPEPTELIIIQNNEDKAELLEVGTITTAVYTIDKANKKLFYIKNGVVPFSLKSVFKIDTGYQMMMTADCK